MRRMTRVRKIQSFAKSASSLFLHLEGHHTSILHGLAHSLYRQEHTSYQTMLGLSAIRHSIARSGGAASNCNYSAAIRALSTNTESLKVSATSTPPPSATKEENIKYFKIYRWDPDHQQKPVSIYSGRFVY